MVKREKTSKKKGKGLEKYEKRQIGKEIMFVGCKIVLKLSTKT